MKTIQRAFLAAFFLAAPALGTGLVVDDYVLQAVANGNFPGAKELDAFRFYPRRVKRQFVRFRTGEGLVGDWALAQRER